MWRANAFNAAGNLYTYIICKPYAETTVSLPSPWNVIRFSPTSTIILNSNPNDFGRTTSDLIRIFTTIILLYEQQLFQTVDNIILTTIVLRYNPNARIKLAAWCSINNKCVVTIARQQLMFPRDLTYFINYNFWNVRVGIIYMVNKRECFWKFKLRILGTKSCYFSTTCVTGARTRSLFHTYFNLLLKSRTVTLRQHYSNIM